MTMYFLGPPCPGKNRGKEIGVLVLSHRIQNLNFSSLFQTEAEHGGQRLRERAAPGQEVEPGVPGGNYDAIAP